MNRGTWAEFIHFTLWVGLGMLIVILAVTHLEAVTPSSQDGNGQVTCSENPREG